MTESKLRDFHRCIAFLTVCGLATVASGFYLLWSTSRFLATAEETEGRVVRIEQSSHWELDDGESVRWIEFHSVIAFEDRNGNEVEFVGSGRTKEPDFAVGATVPMLFDPANPSDARVDRFLDVWGVSLGAIGMGLGWLAITFGFYAVVRRRTRRANARSETFDPTGLPTTMPIEHQQKAWSTWHHQQPTVVMSASWSRTISLKGAFLPGAFSDPKRRFEVILVWVVLPLVPLAFAGFYVRLGYWYVTPALLPVFIGMIQGYRRQWKLARTTPPDPAVLIPSGRAR